MGPCGEFFRTAALEGRDCQEGTRGFPRLGSQVTCDMGVGQEAAVKHVSTMVCRCSGYWDSRNGIEGYNIVTPKLDVRVTL